METTVLIVMKQIKGSGKASWLKYPILGQVEDFIEISILGESGFVSTRILGDVAEDKEAYYVMSLGELADAKDDICRYRQDHRSKWPQNKQHPVLVSYKNLQRSYKGIAAARG